MSSDRPTEPLPPGMLDRLEFDRARQMAHEAVAHSDDYTLRNALLDAMAGAGVVKVDTLQGKPEGWRYATFIVIILGILDQLKNEMRILGVQVFRQSSH